MTYQVKISTIGNKKIAVIKAVREITGLGLKEAKELVEEFGIVAEGLSRSAAKKIQEKLASAGAKSEILPPSTPEPEPEPRPVEPEPTPEPVEPEPTPADPSERDGFIVFGQVLLSNEQPVEACTVRAFDLDLRSEQLVGVTRTDSKGSYKITYTEEQFKRAEKGTADLVIRAYNPVGKLLVESEIVFNASPEERIDLDIKKSAPVQPSVYESLVALLTPLLEGVPLSELTRQDVWFLANETERSIQEIAFIAEDARLSQRIFMPEAVFFGLAINGIGVLQPTGVQKPPIIELAMVLDEPVEHLIDVIQGAVESNLMPSAIRNQLNKIRNRFKSLKLIHKATHLSTDLLTLDLADITNQDIKLVETLSSQELPRIGGHVTSPRDLAALDESDWFSVLKDNFIEPPENQEKKYYAFHIARNIEHQFPTSVFLHRVTGRDSLKLSEQLESTQPLLHSSPHLFTLESRIDYGLVEAEILVDLKKTVQELLRIARSFTYLDVPEIMEDPELPPKKKAKEITKRIAWISRLLERNGELDLFSVDLFSMGENEDGMGVNYEGLKPDEQLRVRRQLMDYQRVLRYNMPSVSEAIQMLESGKPSAL